MLIKRGRDISRLEAFSDAVFGFSATLLVVSLEVPRTFPGLRHYLIFAVMGFFSVLAAAVHFGIQYGVPGWMYALLGPFCWAHAVWSHRRREDPGDVEPELAADAE